MANFLHDQNFENITIDEARLKQIDKIFKDQQTIINSQNGAKEKSAILSYIIRFDSKGYRIFEFEKMLEYFHQASQIERIIFTLESIESLSTNRNLGTCLELRLNQTNPNGCYLSATSDDKNWVDATFCSIKGIIEMCTNWNGWIRTAWTELLIQLLGVIVCFVLSFWGSVKIAPFLKGVSFKLCK